jgi:hypothetical protein
MDDITLTLTRKEIDYLIDRVEPVAHVTCSSAAYGLLRKLRDAKEGKETVAAHEAA